LKNYLRVAVFSFLTLMILGLTGVAAPPVLAGETVMPVTDSEVQAHLAAVQIPFVQNEGQVGDEQVKYYAKTFAGTVFVTDEGIIYSLPKGDEGGWVLKEEFAGGKAPAPAPSSAPGAPVNYYLGNVEKHVSSYDEIFLGEVYDRINVNLKAYGNNVEKIFTVVPGGDPAAISLKVTGANGLNVNGQGELELGTGLGTVKMTSPVAYQIIDGRRVDVNVSYAVNGGSYGFTVGEYDRACPLVIDPLLASTYLGGTFNEGLNGNSIKLDAAGNVYIAGSAKSSYFFLDSQGQAVTGGYSQTLNGTAGTATDAFVVKMDGDLSQYLAATYFGGGGTDSASGITLDGSGNVYVTGLTKSLDFPLASVPCRDTSKGDIYVAKLGGDNLNLSATTCFGGSLLDNSFGVALDSGGHVFVVADTSSASFLDAAGNTLAVNGLQTSLRGTKDGLVVKFSDDLSQVMASTYLGSSGGSEGLTSIAIDNSGNVYVGGYLTSSYTHADTALRKDYKGSNNDGVVFELNNDLNSLLASTFVGGTGMSSKVKLMAFDAAGNIIVCGDTTDTTFSTTTGMTLTGSSDAFVIKIKSDLSGDLVDGVVEPLASTLIGGTLVDYPKDIALDVSDNVYIAGYSNSTSLPGNTADSYQQGLSGGSGYDAFVTKLNPDLSNPATTYIGGAGSETTYGIALNPAGSVYITGTTTSTDFPPAVAPGQSRVAQETNGGGTDIFVAKLTGDLAATAAADSTAPIWPAGELEASEITDTGLTLTWEGAMDNTGVIGYQLYTYQDAGMTSLLSSTTVAGTVYEVTSLEAGTAYTFKVQARDTKGNRSTTGPSRTVATTGTYTDHTRPTWPADKELKATDVAATSLTLTWTSATDNVGVTAYNLYNGSTLLDTVSSAVYEIVSGAMYYTYDVTNLASGNQYTFRAQAVDAIGNISTDGPNVDVIMTNPDTSPPYWNGGGDSNALTFNALSPTTGYFEWPAASDNVGVTGYNIYIQNPPGNGEYSVITTVYGTTNCIITLPDTPGISYPVSIKAFDAAGNLGAYYSYSHPMQVVPGESYGVYLIDAYLTAISGEPRVSSNGASIENSSAVPLNPMIKLYFKNNIVADGVWDNSTYSNKSCVTMQTAAGANVPLNVFRIPDDVDGFNERNNMFVTPVDTLAPGTQYKIIINAALMPKNQKRSLTFERVVNFTTEAAASGNPAWSSGGTMTASNPTPSGVTLTWTPPATGAGVTSYTIIKNNSDIIAGVDGTATSCEVTGLAPGTNYTFQVQAFNSATNWSSDGPSTTIITTADTAVPTWPSASLTESNVAGHGLTLTWSAASDDGAVTGYQIYRDGTSIVTVSGTNLTYNVTGLTAETSYTFKVEAGDAAGNWTTDGPSRTVATTAYTGNEVITGAYSVTPTADAAYTSGETADGIDTMTVNAGYSGSTTFTVSISPVTAHDGNEKAVFVQIRNGAQLNLNASAADFDAVTTASASFEVQPGDVIKAFIVDDLYTTTNIISTVLEQ